MKLRKPHGYRLRAVASAAGLAASLSTTTVPTLAQEPIAAPESDGPAVPAPEPTPDAPPAPTSTGPSKTPTQGSPLGPAPAEAQPPPAPAPKNPERPACNEPAATASADQKNRHTGFHVRGELGLATVSASASTQGSRFDLGGPSAIASLLVGGALAENLIVAGELWTIRTFDPDWKLNGATVGTSSDISASWSGIGVNVTYYLMPANVFFSVTPSLGVLALEDGRDRTSVRTKTGFSARMAVGKEWWVASHFGIGVAANGYFGVNGDELTTDAARSTFNWTTLGAGAALTGSYN